MAGRTLTWILYGLFHIPFTAINIVLKHERDKTRIDCEGVIDVRMVSIRRLHMVIGYMELLIGFFDLDLLSDQKNVDYVYVTVNIFLID